MIHGELYFSFILLLAKRMVLLFRKYQSVQNFIVARML